MLEKQLIYDKPSTKATPYYIMEQVNNDTDNNTNNTNDYQMGNVYDSQEITINTSEKDEKSAEQCSREPSIYEDVTTPTGFQNKMSNHNILEDQITTLKADLVTTTKLYVAGNI